MSRGAFLLAVAVMFFAPAYPQEVGFTIAGVAVNAGSNLPLAKVLVRVQSSSDPAEHRLVVTSADGRFSFTRLPADKFVLTVARQSGPPHFFLEDGAFSTAIVTGPDQDTSNIVFPFHMPGSLSGVVLDESGEPVRNAQVHLYARRIVDGRNRIFPAGMQLTKSSGSFVFSHLLPGTYFAGVSAQVWFANGSSQARGYGRNEPAPSQTAPRMPVSRNRMPAPVTRPDPQFDVAYPFTFFGGTLDPATAAPITVSEGGTATGVQVVLRAVPAIHVRLIGGIDAQPERGINVQALALGPEGQPAGPAGNSFVNGGQGELNGLASGRYQLQIHSYGGREAGDDYTGTRRVVDLMDGATVDVRSVAHMNVKATVKIEGDDRPTNPIILLLQDPVSGHGARANTLPDGSFRFSAANLFPGHYRVLIPNNSAFTVTSVTASGAKLVDGEVALEDNADVQLSVVIARRDARKLQGFALRDGKPRAGAMVLLVPQKTASSFTIYRDESDSDGSFEIASVAPGAYLAIGIDNGRDFAYAEPGVLKPYLAGATPLQVSNSPQSSRLEVTVQQRQQ